jgi:hypothetical protein
MRRAHFCAERAAEKEQRGIVKFSDVVQRRRGGRAVQVAALLLAEPGRIVRTMPRGRSPMNASVTRPQDSTLASRPGRASAEGRLRRPLVRLTRRWPPSRLAKSGSLGASPFGT